MERVTQNQTEEKKRFYQKAIRSFILDLRDISLHDLNRQLVRSEQLIMASRWSDDGSFFKLPKQLDRTIR